MYMFIKMSSGWFCKKITSIEAVEEDISCHIEQGEIVAFGDDIETFAEEIEIEVDYIEMV